MIKPASLNLCLLIWTGAQLVNGASFTDDRGEAVSFPDNPRIACGAMDAVAFFHFGMPASQIMYTYGERSASGSNYGGIYGDGNLVDHGTHGETPYNPDLFPSDPDDAERAFLSEIDDLSPSCSASNYFCDEINIDIFNQNPPDLLVVGSFYNFLLTDSVVGNATAKNVPIIVLTNSYGTANRDNLPRSMIEMTDRMLELAVAIGVGDAQSRAANDQASLCQARQAFVQATRTAQDRGVRVMAGYLPYAGYGVNGEVGAFLASPERDPVLAMMEELGMPLVCVYSFFSSHEPIACFGVAASCSTYTNHSLHFTSQLHVDSEPQDSYEYATDFTTGTLAYDQPMSSGTLGNPVPYHIDFWLYDDRVTLDFRSDSFAQTWPHVAVTQKQYAYYPAGGKIYSYRHASEILTIVAEQLERAQRLTEPATCTEVDADSEGHRTTGLPPGDYACYDPVIYYCCETEAGNNPASDSLASGVSVPVASVQSLFGVPLIAAAIGTISTLLDA